MTGRKSPIPSTIRNSSWSSTQRIMDLKNTLFLADDGYSGTNFDRPAWKKIIEMVERDEVETIIVKDLSRLGREYLQVGQYTEIYFPEKGVRVYRGQ